MKTNKGLVKYAEMALSEEWGYVWGTWGKVLTQDVLQQKLKQYPSVISRHLSFIHANWMNKKTADCVGLIKSYVWFDEAADKLRYDGSTDVNANGMYQRAKRKGRIATIPEVPGLCVYRQGHIGVYVGGGMVIEAMGTLYGVRKTVLKNRNFTHWLECPFIKYEKEVIIVASNTPSSWAVSAQKFVKAKKISDGTRPKDPVTREQTWAMLQSLYRVIKNEIQ